MKRVASVIGLNSEDVEEYKRIHAEVWPTVLERIRKSNIRNYSIYLFGNTLFSYFEYVGNDFEADMSSMANDPETQRWWKITDPMQHKLPEAGPDEWWHELPEVFHTD